MPATAGRVRMPANNRVHSSAALQTHGIWQSAIGYDPYAPDQKQAPPAAAPGDRPAALSADQQNMYDSFQGLLALARLTGSNADEARGACRKCGRVGHLPFQCRNFLKDEAAVLGTLTAVGLSGSAGGNSSSHHRKARSHDKGSDKAESASDESSDDEVLDSDDSGISDSSADSVMERAIAAKYGKNVLKSICKKNKAPNSKELSTHRRSHSRKNKSNKVDDSGEKREKKSKYSSKLKRSHSSSPDSDSYESNEEEDRKKRRRHSHKHVKSRSKHHRNHFDDSSKRKSKRHSKKQKPSHKYRSSSESD